MRIWWGFLVMGLVGCGAEEREPPGEEQDEGPCAARTGSYLMTLTERSGNCGAIPEQVIVIDGQGSDSNVNCTGGSTASDDNCAVTLDTTCTYTSGEFAGQSLRQKGTVRWSASGASGSGTLQYTVTGPDASLNCASTYAVSYARQLARAPARRLGAAKGALERGGNPARRVRLAHRHVSGAKLV